jgi:quercetin dioxygenase-like cupin family protein
VTRQRQLERWENEGGAIPSTLKRRELSIMTTLERSSGTTERSLDEPVMTFDLRAIVADIKRESTWRTARRNAVTLQKQPGFRVVLVALQAAEGLAPHATDSPVSVQALEGELVVVVGTEEFVLPAGQLLTLRPGIEHGVRATTESAFLLTLATEATHPAEA